MKRIGILFLLLCSMLFSSCGVTLLAPKVQQNSSLIGYKYFYVTPTEERSSVIGSVYNGVGSSTTHSVNPADIITGYLVKRGYVRVPELRDVNRERTFIINYGETGRRQASIFAYTIEVTLQFISADTHDVLAVSTAEGCGTTEADDIRIAINRSLDAVFP